MTVAERIRFILTTQGISARELSRRAGLAESHISLMLKALEKDPLAVGLKTLDAIARAGGVSLAWLAAGEEPPQQAPPVPPDPFPARAQALAFGGATLLPETVKWAREAVPADAERLDRVGWLRALLWHDEFLRGGSLPPSAPTSSGRGRRGRP